MRLLPSVDVIIPCFNGADFIERCVSSVLKQTYKELHIIFVDDGSTDSSLEVISLLSNQMKNLTIISKSNGGASSARNMGLRNSTGAYVAFLDVDDYWMPEKIEHQLTRLKYSTGAIASNYLIERDGVLRNGIQNYSQEEISPKSLLSFTSVIPGSASSVLLHRNIVDKCGFFDESLNYGEDLDYWIRIAQQYKWVISEFADVVILDNPLGMQSNEISRNKNLLSDSIRLLDRNRSLLTHRNYLILKLYFEFTSRKHILDVLVRPSLLIGAYYSILLKLYRNVRNKL